MLSLSPVFSLSSVLSSLHRPRSSRHSLPPHTATIVFSFSPILLYRSVLSPLLCEPLLPPNLATAPVTATDSRIASHDLHQQESRRCRRTRFLHLGLSSHLTNRCRHRRPPPCSRPLKEPRSPPLPPPLACCS
ncbi:hypothetical protein RIF29_09204 [Crotalaria pallida]|uniref:Uncharacterized protein n=1 Tax=Crotalaria pallida TaxID=3830 RepID=A0AAN9FRN6_CROPI